MWLKLKMAFRNTFRNRRRTALNVLMIAGGVSTMLLFEGLVHRMVVGLRETTIKTQTGHLQIAKQSYWKKTSKSPKDTLIGNYEAHLKNIKKNPHVTYATGRLSFFCLLTKGERSLSAQGISFDPKAEYRRQKSFKFIEGRGLHADKKFEVALGSGLAKKLKIRAGDQVVLLGQTYDGVVNALEMKVTGIFQTAISEFDDNSFIIPLTSAQTLLDTKGVEQIVVGLDDTSSTGNVRNELNRRLDLASIGISIRTWYFLATLYRQVAEFNRVQNTAFKFIIMSLILLSIMNTIGNSIAERTGEIGTVRAMGEKPSSLVIQFLMEGLILGVMGAMAGIILGTVMGQVVNAMKIPVMMPGASAFFYLEIDFLWSSVKEAAVVSVVSAGVAAVIPAIRASRMNIIESLRRYV